MKRKRNLAGKHPAPATAVPPARRSGAAGWWCLAAGLFLAVFAALDAYQPALHGPFVYDDLYLPYLSPAYTMAPLIDWLHSVRPVLYFTYWLNFRLSGIESLGYHVVNVVLHLFTSLFAYLIVRRILCLAEPAPSPGIPWRRELLAGFAGFVYLLHPAQTESVAYVASRSETLSVMLFYAAFTAFLYRRRAAVSVPVSLAILALFGLAVLTKEHCAVLPALLLLTDFYWNPGFSLQGAKRNWKLYLPIALVAVAGGVRIWRVLAVSPSAGLRVRDLSPLAYFFTECRAVWDYVRLFLLPYGQNIDYNFPISRSLLDHGAIFGLAALAGAVLAAWHWRRRFPMASYGVFVFLLLLAPTSSVIPIRDPFVEHRLYLPMIGLLLVAVDLLWRWKARPAVLGGVLATAVVVLGVLCYNRNQVWSSEIALWEDSVAKAPRHARPRFQLAYAYYQVGRCGDAVREYEKAAETARKPEYQMLVDWGLADDCAGRPDDALVTLKRARDLSGTAHVNALIGMVYGKQGKSEEALTTLDRAVALDPSFAMTYTYRGNVRVNLGDYTNAASDYRKALSLDPSNQAALQGLAVIEQRLRKGG